MRMTIRDAVKLVDVAEQFSNAVQTSQVSLNDLLILGEINTSILEDVEFLQGYFAYLYGEEDAITNEPIVAEEVTADDNPWLSVNPNVDWRLVYDLNYMVSENGDIWDVDNNCLIDQYFINGDMRIFVEGDLPNMTKRVSAIVCRAFGIKSSKFNLGFKDSSQIVIDFIDGDRRNCRYTNLRWIEKSRVMKTWQVMTTEDICRRLVDFNGDVDKVLTMYDKTTPIVTKDIIQNIKTKKTDREISDLFFVYQNGSFFPRAHVEKIGNDSFDVAGFFVSTGDKDTTLKLLKDKIKDDKKVTPDEITIMVKSLMGNYKKPDSQVISDEIASVFGISIPFDIVQESMNDTTSVVATTWR